VTPIAIVGRACLLPGASSPAELAELCRDGRDTTSEVAPGRWGISGRRVMGATSDTSGDRTWTDRGGYVTAFEERFDPEGFGLPAAEVRGLDPIFQWTMHVAREALLEAGPNVDRARTGAILGNLSFPPDLFARFAESVWLAGTPLAPPRPDPRNRFSSAGPALLLGQALGLEGPRHCLDAACASSLYAIGLACQALQAGEVDWMLAGAVNRADDLFIHVGFCALQAMSKSGRSRPFSADADGLVPAEGCAMVVLRRLEDALADGDRIFGVIRGVGLSNDGRGRGLLSPHEDGQIRAMKAAWEEAGLDPRTCAYVECHATGTTVGDATELRSMQEVFAPGTKIGSLKANFGHAVTAAGAAGLLKVLAGFQENVLYPTPHLERPSAALVESPFEVVKTLEPWPAGRPRICGVSAFGFGGNDAHLVVDGVPSGEARRGARTQVIKRPPRVAIVALGARVGPLGSAEAFASALAGGGPLGPRAEAVELELQGLRFPPADLQHTIAQQTMLLAAAREAFGQASGIEPAKTAVIVGMGTDPEVARWGARWRIADKVTALGGDEALAAAAREAIAPHLTAATVVGTMPNIPANRVSSDLDLKGPSFTVSSEERSGTVALRIARKLLEDLAVDAALACAVDLSVEPVHAEAARALLPDGRQKGADAAVALVLVREKDAHRLGLPVMAIVGDDFIPSSTGELALDVDRSSLTARLGHAHAASGLLHVAAAALALSRVGVRAGLGLPAGDAIRVLVPCLFGEPGEILLLEGAGPRPIGPARELGRTLKLPAHPPAIHLPPLPKSEPETVMTKTNGTKNLPSQRMAAAPWVPPVGAPRGASGSSEPGALPRPLQQSRDGRGLGSLPQSLLQAGGENSGSLPQPLSQAGAESWGSDDEGLFAALAEQHRAMTDAHRVFLETQLELHQRFLTLRERASATLSGASDGVLESAPDAVALPVGAPISVSQIAVPPASRPVPVPVPASTPAAAIRPAPAAPAAARPAPAATPTKPGKRTGGIQPDPFRAPVGRSWDREGLKVHAGGQISTIFGPEFRPQDARPIQTRMPMEPMLLADRATGIDATPAAMLAPLESDPRRRKGTVWTETDVTSESWYLHLGRMPGGILIESGQADLFLISYLGIDMLNLENGDEGKRAYRLLGCDLTYHRSPPRVGETIGYDIHVDGHANQGPIRLFFFHYDCRVRPLGSSLPADGGEPLLSVRNGQAGFFTRRELDESAGILWKAQEQEIVKEPRLDAPAVPLTKTSFTNEEIRAFSEGKTHLCFGPDFDTRPHVRTPRIAEGRLMFLERIDTLESRGGPWKRGYLKATTTIHPDDWYFPGHFLNDPCMPGTLMFEGCLQAMAFYLASQGVTLSRDGWRFEPITGETYKLLCRGQVTPESKELVYEVFVEELVAGPVPMLYADLLCTVDGLGAFHARRMGLRLVPDWPLEEYQRPFSADSLAPPPKGAPPSLPQLESDRPVAVAASGPSTGFRFDYHSLLACAWGRPSSAFGEIYERFDSPRKVARLPGPPYHFMSRIADVQGPMGEPKAGASVVVDYDVPPPHEGGVWYFRENGAPTMPYAVLMEAALQPCGWLASYIGSALTEEGDLLFRNLDGKATLFTDIVPSSGTLTTRATLKSYSKSGTMIIVSFDVECSIGGQKVYALDTVFGFFPPEAFENQAGLPVSDAQKALFGAPATDEQVQLKGLPEHPYRVTAPRLASPFLCMIDRIVHVDRAGGAKGLGAFRAEKDVDPDEWFFKAHFFQDPVQPGSLGVEAMCQLLQCAMRLKGLDRGFARPRFEPVGLERPHVWKYRGQVVPRNRLISCTLELTEIGVDARGTYALSDASLWVDGKRIYDAKGLAMRIVEDTLEPLASGPPPSSSAGRISTAPVSEAIARMVTDPAEGPVEVLTLAEHPWLRDHAPTWVLPALPATFFLDRLHAYATELGQRQGRPLFEIEHLAIERWVTLSEAAPQNGEARLRPRVLEREDGSMSFAIEAFRAARDPRLSRFESVANARVRFDEGGQHRALGEGLVPLEGGVAQPDPYASGTLFHGPSFQLVTELVLGENGATATLDCTRAPADPRARRTVILDAALHAIPHDGLHVWDPGLPHDRAAYPRRIESAMIGELPVGIARVEARYLGKDEHGQARTRVVLFDGSMRACADLVLVEVLLPKGPIGTAPPLDRRAFLEGEARAGVGLSALHPDHTRLTLRDVAVSNWLPGTVERVYHLGPGADVPLEIAARDHVAQRTGSHPRHVRLRADHGVALTEPFVRHPLTITRDEASVLVRSEPPRLDLSVVRAFWRRLLGGSGEGARHLGAWPGEELHLALIERFMGRMRVADPDALAKIHGRSVLFLGNHQVGIESLLFGIAASALVGTPTTTLAKHEHKESWLGRLIGQSFAWPELVNRPSVIAFFDRSDPSSLPKIIQELGQSMRRPEGQSVMIHVEGTRQTAGGRPVSKMSGVFVDLAMMLGAPIVPVRFSRALPAEPVIVDGAETRLEFPIGLGRQDYDLGTPLLPEDLEKLPYKDRTERVMAAINETGVPHDQEAPCAPDPDLSARAETWKSRAKSWPHAVIAAVLDERRKGPRYQDLGPELSELLDSLESGEPVEGAGRDGAWLAELRALFR
jgi:3-oxoacyl-(acyl-carrier-protein) synthase/3-hydroxymyristoyl/3-hydroxydecanoyl-(acyl carrier protein) dehydratase